MTTAQGTMNEKKRKRKSELAIPASSPAKKRNVKDDTPKKANKLKKLLKKSDKRPQMKNVDTVTAEDISVTKVPMNLKTINNLKKEVITNPSTTNLSTSQNKKEKKELSARQKHKNWKRKQKKKGKWPTVKKDNDEEKESVEAEEKSSCTTFTKIVIPRSPESISSNWKKLKSVLDTERKKKEEEALKKGRRIRAPLRTRKKDDTDSEKQTNTQESKPEIWFDDVDEIFLDKSEPSLAPSGTTESSEKVEKNPLVKLGAYKGLTKAVGMDCEMVGVGDGDDDMLARVSIVNQFGEKLYDKFVRPKEKVVDYRTHVSGVRPEDLKNGEDFFLVQKEVAEILKGRILVGHAIDNDLKVLYLSHPRRNIRDTSQYRPFRQLFKGKTPSLKKLTQKVLTVSVQEGEHNSIQDAQAAIRLYTQCKKQWEKELRIKAVRKSRPKVSSAKLSQQQKTGVKS